MRETKYVLQRTDKEGRALYSGMREGTSVDAYTCGLQQIISLRTYWEFEKLYRLEDLLEKTLRYVGYDVKRVMDITDVGHLSGVLRGHQLRTRCSRGKRSTRNGDGDNAKVLYRVLFADCAKLNIRNARCR